MSTDLISPVSRTFSFSFFFFLLFLLICLWIHHHSFFACDPGLTVNKFSIYTQIAVKILLLKLLEHLSPHTNMQKYSNLNIQNMSKTSHFDRFPSPQKFKCAWGSSQGQCPRELLMVNCDFVCSFAFKSQNFAQATKHLAGMCVPASPSFRNSAGDLF